MTLSGSCRELWEVYSVSVSMGLVSESVCCESMFMSVISVACDGLCWVFQAAHI